MKLDDSLLKKYAQVMVQYALNNGKGINKGDTVFLVGQVGLWIAALLTLITGYDYLAEGLKHVGEDMPRQEERPKPAAKPARPIL